MQNFCILILQGTLESALKAGMRLEHTGLKSILSVFSVRWWEVLQYLRQITTTSFEMLTKPHFIVFPHLIRFQRPSSPAAEVKQLFFSFSISCSAKKKKHVNPKEGSCLENCLDLKRRKQLGSIWENLRLCVTVHRNQLCKWTNKMQFLIYLFILQFSCPLYIFSNDLVLRQQQLTVVYCITHTALYSTINSC